MYRYETLKSFQNNRVYVWQCVVQPLYLCSKAYVIEAKSLLCVRYEHNSTVIAFDSRFMFTKAAFMYLLHNTKVIGEAGLVRNT